jgi:hypothetical protein
MQGEKGLKGDTGERGPTGTLRVAEPWTERVHYAGEVVTHSGGTWQAVRDTGRPVATEDWVCLAAPGAAGRDGRDGRGMALRGTYAPGMKYAALEIVALNGASFVARRDDPGPCPGDGWQLLVKQGKQGPPGEGVKGDRGERAPRMTGWQIDRQRYLATPVMADGTQGPPLELRELFQQFQQETAPES